MWASELLPPLPPDKATGLVGSLFGGRRKAQGRGDEKFQASEGPWGSGLTNEREEEATCQERGRMEVRG